MDNKNMYDRQSVKLPYLSGGLLRLAVNAEQAVESKGSQMHYKLLPE